MPNTTFGTPEKEVHSPLTSGQIDLNNPKHKSRDTGRPLITFLLVAYNQERFIPEAVEGAFSQSYSPLEIILSDDCSTDTTYKIMEQMAATYTGQHQITLNRNKQNLRVAAHLNRCIDLSHGELIVTAAGDDISLPQRVTTIYRAWVNSGESVSSLFSNVEMIDAKGIRLGLWFPHPPQYTRNIDDFKKSRRSWVTGCSHAFPKRLFTKYGRLHPKVIQEDGTLSFRALLEGGILYIDEVLVKYRQHQGNIYNLKDPQNLAFLRRREYYMKASWLCDAERSDIHDKQLLGLLRRELAKAFVKRLAYSVPFVGVVFHQALNGIKRIRRSLFCLIGLAHSR